MPMATLCLKMKKEPRIVLIQVVFLERFSCCYNMIPDTVFFVKETKVVLNLAKYTSIQQT